MRQAKVSITGDARGFKKQVDDAKKSLEGLGKVKVTDATKTLSQQIVDLQKKIKSLNETKALLGKGGIAQNELPAWKAINKEIKENTLLLKANIAARTAKGETPDKRDKLPDVEEEKKKKPAKGMGVSDIKSVLAVAAGGYGIMSMWQRRVQMASERLPIRALTTDSGLPSERSKLGFTPEERRQRSLAMAGEASPMTGKALESLTNMGEQLQRAYGISGEQSAGAVGAARRAGVDNQEKFVRGAVDTAAGAGMKGSQISEYLSSMTGFLSEISKGVNIDTDSLNGFAGAMAKMPFFKSNPERIFDMMRGMNSGFTNGDEFQKAQAMRAISASAPEASASGIEMRRSMGIWGGMDKNKKGDKDTLEKLQAQGMDTKVLEVTGGEIVSNIMKEIEEATKGMSKMDQAKQLGARLNVSDRTALELMANKGNIGKMDKVMQEAQMSPEEKLKAVMENMDGTIKSVDAQLEDVKDAMAEKIADPMARLATSMDELIKALGMNTEAIASTVGALAIVGTTIAGAYALISKFMPAAEVAAEAAESAAAAGEVVAGGATALSMGAAAVTGAGIAGIGYALSPTDAGAGSDMIPQGAPSFGERDKRSQFDFGQNDMFPQLPSTKSVQDNSQPGLMTSGIGVGTDPDTQATTENTSVLKELTGVMRQVVNKTTGGGSRMPSYGQPSMAMGKHR